MKAWKVYDPTAYERCAVIVFAESNSKARAQSRGRDEFDGSEYLDLRAERVRDFDGRENNPPTMYELVTEHGWYTYCARCEVGIDADADEDSEGWQPPGMEHRLGVLCKACASKTPEEWAKQEAEWKAKASVLPDMPGTPKGGAA